MVFNTLRCGVCMSRKVQDPTRCTNIYHSPPPGFETLIFPRRWGNWQPRWKAQAPTFGPLDLKVLLVIIHTSCIVVVVARGQYCGVRTNKLQIERLGRLLFESSMMSDS